MGTGASVLRDNPIGCSFKGGLFGYVIDLPPDHWVWHREQYNYFEYSKLSDAPSSEIDSLLDFEENALIQNALQDGAQPGRERAL